MRGGERERGGGRKERERERERERESKQKQRTQLQYLSIRERKTDKYSELRNGNIKIRQTGRQADRQTGVLSPVSQYGRDRQTDRQTRRTQPLQY